MIFGEEVDEPHSELTVTLREQHADLFTRNLAALIFERTWYSQAGHPIHTRAWWSGVHRAALEEDFHYLLPQLEFAADFHLRPWGHSDRPAFQQIDLWPPWGRQARRLGSLRFRFRLRWNRAHRLIRKLARRPMSARSRWC